MKLQVNGKEVEDLLLDYFVGVCNANGDVEIKIIDSESVSHNLKDCEIEYIVTEGKK